MQGTWKACGTGNQPISKLHIKVLVTNYWLFCWESFVWMQLQHCIREPQRYFYSPYIWISWWRNWSLERLSVSCLRVNRWVITKSLKTQLTVTCSWWQIRSMILLAHQDFLIEMERLKVTIKFLAWTPGRMAVSLIEIRNTGRNSVWDVSSAQEGLKRFYLEMCVRCSCGNRRKDNHFNKSQVSNLVGRIKLALVTSFYFNS